MSKATQVRLARRPDGLPQRDDFAITHDPPRAPGEGEVLVEVTHISLDPAMRGWMNEGKSYIPPVGLGEVMRAGAVGRVAESRAPGIARGDYVYGLLNVQTHATAHAGEVQKIDPRLAPPERFLGALGMPGMTAYFGLLDIGRPKTGETVLVSGAAGAVGSLVGQIAKIKGCRAVGIAGGAEKCAYVTDELGFDACIDYKGGDVYAGLRQHCPKGVDVYFDNVGGEILDIVLRRIARGARIVICGAISQYNDMANIRGPANYTSLLVNRARMEGFVVFDYAPRYAEGMADMAKWMGEGRLTARKHIVAGLDTFADALAMLFTGANTGKLVLTP